MTELERIARAYPPEAAHTPADERERHFTTAQQLAWELRFGERRRTVARVTSGGGPR